MCCATSSRGNVLRSYFSYSFFPYETVLHTRPAPAAVTLDAGRSGVQDRAASRAEYRPPAERLLGVRFPHPERQRVASQRSERGVRDCLVVVPEPEDQLVCGLEADHRAERQLFGLVEVAPLVPCAQSTRHE